MLQRLIDAVRHKQGELCRENILRLCQFLPKEKAYLPRIISHSDLAPADFWQFTELGNVMKGKCFSEIEDILKTF